MKTRLLVRGRASAFTSFVANLSGAIFVYVLLVVRFTRAAPSFRGVCGGAWRTPDGLVARPPEPVEPPRVPAPRAVPAWEWDTRRISR